MPQLLPGVTYLPVPIQLHASPPGSAHAPLKCASSLRCQLVSAGHFVLLCAYCTQRAACLRTAWLPLLAAAIVGCSRLASSRCCGCCPAQSCHIWRSICDTELLDCFCEPLTSELSRARLAALRRAASLTHGLCSSPQRSACNCVHEQLQHLEPRKTAMTRKCKLEYDLGSTHALHSCKTQCQ